ncbi:hypothetical protein [Kitasatospora sp. NBC_01302]|uniref:hypothetical protein n=1 Tax=Kitasatospora sp. NBC_01302 TaxID=2903575 RepID=UPI002E16843E|nr:hypothetical protein OG294_40250 [Kitasatospora sp. NBC_01302]
MEKQNSAVDRPTEYTWWGEVPDHLVTKTRLADLDLPRQPGGPVRATITARGPGGKGTFNLYDIRESTPTATTVAQLAARRTNSSRTCEECGAHPETPCTETPDGELLCAACAHIHRLRAKQQEAADRARVVGEQAVEHLADEHLVVLSVHYTHRPPTESGKPRPPAAARITVLDPHDALPLYDRTLRLTGPRTPGAPVDAVDPAPALDDLATLLADRTVALWDNELQPLSDALRHLKVKYRSFLPSGYRRVVKLQVLVSLWRADLDPATGQYRVPVPPGSAERLLYLLRAMAGAVPVQRVGEAALPGL